MIRGIFERFMPDNEVRYKTYLKRVAVGDLELSNDIRESVPKAIRTVYPSYTFEEIMNLKVGKIASMMLSAHTKAEEVSVEMDGHVTNMQIDNLLRNTQHKMSVVNTNCRLFWDDPI